VRNDVKRKIKRLILKPFAIVLKTLKFFPFYNNIRSACYKLIGSRDFVNAEESNVFLKQSYLNVISNDLTKNFRELDIDTLLIRGEKDTYTPLSDGRHIRMNIKDSDLIIMDGKNHSIHLQSPLELSKILLEAAK
jgi:pimeloyl-ACP methyl ester carboxylesterase